MNLVDTQNYAVPALILAFFGWRFFRFAITRRQLPQLLAQGAVVIDVRSPAEFLSGAKEGAINMPLDTLEQKAARLDPAKPVVLCCASGTRSSMAAAILKRKGFKHVVNAGPWRNTVL